MSLKVLVSYHSYSEEFVNKLNSYLKKNGFDTFLMNENEPKTLNLRAKAIRIANVVLVIASRPYQRSIACMEVINYAKDKKKQLNAINPYTTYRPFGALGAIIAGMEGCLINIDTPEALDDAFAKLEASLNTRPKSSRKFADMVSSDVSEENVDLEDDARSADVLISYCKDFESNAGLAEKGIKEAGISYIKEDSSNGTSSIKNVKVLIIIMSESYETSKYCRQVFEIARISKMPIIPVSTIKKWKPENWLGLAIAGKIYYRLFNEKQAYQKNYDSTPMNDFIFAIKKSIAIRPSEEDREKAQINALKTQIDECRGKLSYWPPKSKPAIRKELKAVKVTLPEPKADLQFTHQHYEVTRLEFNVPKPLYDDFGVPLRTKFDSMISYQWDHQDLVRDVYMDLHMKSLSIWFDIWGGMEGSTTDSMATAVECSKVVLVFLSNEYQKSENCQLEFRYALSRGKPFIFILVEKDLKIEPWIEPYFNESYSYEIFSKEDEGILHNGVPRIDVIAQAIRTIGSAQSDDNSYDLSEEVFEMRQLLNNALDDIANVTGTERFKTCTRCKKQYDDNSKNECKSHSAYYLGGTIMEGRWVCCNQQSKDAIGCKNTNHIDKPRVWTKNKDYGTHTWEPA